MCCRERWILRCRSQSSTHRATSARHCSHLGGTMARPLLLLHGYSAQGLDFSPLCEALKARGVNSVDLNVGNYISLNNEITIKDIAAGLDRAFRMRPDLNDCQEFDAIVHSTGMLVIRSWLTNYGAAVGSNSRLKQLKHLIGVAPATWG